jgi:putative transposase
MPALSIEEKCRLAEVSRAGFYRYLHAAAPAEEDLALRDRLQKLVAETKQRRGYRPITYHLQREGWQINHKRVLRLMGEDNLLCLRKKKYVLTTDSRHEFQVYTNLARGLKVAALNQLWVSDITFIRLRTEFVYLAVVLDAHSRRVIGWELGRTLRTELPLAALQQALKERSWKTGQLVHHSDRGVQYASEQYTKLLEQNGIAISMSRAGNPYDNARAERFMRTLKHEEVYASEYHDIEDARARIGQFLEQVYNQKRLHSALGYQTPAEFERDIEKAAVRPVSGKATP